MQPGDENRVLVIGAQGVLGGLLVEDLSQHGWEVIPAGRRPNGDPAFRHVDLDEPESLAAALRDIELVVNAVPEPALTAERMVLSRGGVLINVSALPAAAGQRLRRQATAARGTVIMNAGVAPGVTNLIAAALLAEHPEADEVELVFTLSVGASTGRAGREFAHRGLTGVPDHRTARIALPEPYGPRRCLGFAELDAGWLGSLAGDRVVSPYLCIAEAPVHAALLAINRTRLMSKLPRSALVSSSGPRADKPPGRERIAHWVGVRKDRRLLAARTLQCRGDYRAAAAATSVFARAVHDDAKTSSPRPGVFDPQEVLSLDRLSDALGLAGMTVVQQPVRGEPAVAASSERQR
ncbi:MAG TPA: NAD-dependent epimerase/dehydratase family protein [Solirubrobacteraceae bacterium]